MQGSPLNNWGHMMLTLRAALDGYIAEVVNLRSRTVSFYRSAVNSFESWLGREADVTDLTKANVVGLMRATIDGGHSARTANNKRSVLITLWRYAAAEGYLDPPPTIRKAHEEHAAPKAWTLRQIEAALQAAEHAKIYKGWGPRHWVALIHVCYATASRIGAVAKLPRDAFDGRYLRTPASAAKCRRELIHRLPDACVAAINAMPAIDGSDRLLFPSPYEVPHGGIQEAFRRHVATPAGINDEIDRVFHGIRRHSYTVVADKLGFDAAGALAGHTCDMRAKYFDPRLARHAVDPVTALPELKAG